MRLRTRLASALSSMLDALQEVNKAVALELFSLGGKMATAFFVVLLFLTGADLRAYWKQRNPIAEQKEALVPAKQRVAAPTPFARLVDKESSFGNLSDLEAETLAMTPPKMPFSAPTLSAADASPTSPVRSSSREPERPMSGLTEDLKTTVLLAIDGVFLRMKQAAEWAVLTPVKTMVSSSLLTIATLPLALLLLLLKGGYSLVAALLRGGGGGSSAAKGALSRAFEGAAPPGSIKDVVARNGYPFKRYQVVTQDGYILRLDRIPRPEAIGVVYLQHGVFDNSFAWVSSGTQSLAYRLHDMGFDVWLGNLRGTTCADNGRRHLNENLPSRDYWHFSLNEHAMFDFPAFMHKIRTVKKTEGVAQPKITVVSHSLGAAVTLMYLVFRKLGLTRVPTDFDDYDSFPLPTDSRPQNGGSFSVSAKRRRQGRGGGGGGQSEPEDEEEAVVPEKDFVVAALLLSPAGVHVKAPKLVYLMVPLIETLLFFLPIYVFKAPSRGLGNMMAKVWEDVKQTPTAKFVLGLFTALLLGGEVESHPIHSIKPQNVFEGTSVTIYRQFVQIWRAGKFQAFDYGWAKNLKMYGSEKPLSVIDNYDKIDIPVAFCYGSGDPLISPENVKIHYRAMDPKLASLYEFDTGHLEFTVGLKDSHISKILEILKSLAPQ